MKALIEQLGDLPRNAVTRVNVKALIALHERGQAAGIAGNSAGLETVVFTLGNMAMLKVGDAMQSISPPLSQIFANRPDAAIRLAAINVQAAGRFSLP